MDAPAQTTPQALRLAARTWPDGPAIIDDQWGATTVLNWQQLLGQARVFAAALIDAGIAPGDRVAIWAPNSYHWPIAALGTHYAGAVLVPLNTRYTISEAADIIERADARVIVTVGEFVGTNRLADLLGHAISGGRTIVGISLDTTAPSPSGAISWTEFLTRGTNIGAADARADAVESTDLSDILFTSGTTGAPKGVLAEHRQTLAGARAWGANGALGPHDRYLQANPYFHTFGYKAGILPSLLFGTTMVPLAVFSPDAAMRKIDEHAITVFPGAPTVFQTILDSPGRSGHDLSTLRLVVTGATVVPVVLVERLQSDLGVETVLTAYGQTETSGFITTCTAADDDVTVATTCGRAYPGMAIKLDNPDENGAGEVLAKGAMVMRGYLDDPAATAKAIDDDGWLHTGDVGTIDDNGNLRITDRLKDMYICGGFNVYPAEVEQVLARADGVAEVAVIGVPDDRLGEVGRAFVTAKPGAEIDPDAVVAHAREHLANFKVPRSVVVVDGFPRNASGKILKRELS
ncbi:putative fatty-acid--CoA ligase [Gordonia araii NBRC 100433]|uniref:Putative fatty-acid--CoA ligase n=1 Tax=Gordonia araii NBRC 100433 TaxID=1073574 RepID=G7GZZ0_9ACTN|nr:FadD3 family acyl-CoA ligase [Gordonia araii]NNG98344.1 AMP-binding protein [Gordonia araii NBRC 100433]GAB09165.1 putative fatty-acid--CoA ligase [Gordonia araii NBRC 100433]